MVEREGLALLKRLAFAAALPHPRASAWASRLVGAVQHILGLDLRNNPLRMLFPLFGLRADRDIPPFGRRTLLARLPEMLKPMGDEKARVVYFPGCAINLLYPEIGLASVRLLRKLGAKVILPREMVCCSTPVFIAGDVARARALAERNLKCFTRLDFDYIVTSCGSCGLTIKREWADVLGVMGAESISSRVLDITEFVTRFVPDDGVRLLDADEIVTYHDSCHLRRGIDIWREPRQLLAAALGNRFIEMEYADRCCGGGGMFCIENPDLSQTVAAPKVQAIAAIGAHVTAAGCPACVMQLRDSLTHRGVPGRVIHTVEIIDRAVRAAE